MTGSCTFRIMSRVWLVGAAALVMACGREINEEPVPDGSESGGGTSLGGGSPEANTGAGDGSSADFTPAASSGSSGSGGSSELSSSGTVSSRSGGSGTGNGSSGGIDAGGCIPGDSQCSSASAIQTCDVTGRWGMPWPCATSTCSGGTCMGSTVAATSCQGSGGPGLTDCGASSESCCTSLEVAGGTYTRTYDFYVADGGPMNLADPATVSGFRLDKYLVTVGRFRQFVNAVFPSDGGSGWLPAPGSGKHVHLNGGNGLNATGGGYEPGWMTTDDINIAPTDTNLACQAVYATWTNTAGAQETRPINCVNWYEAYAFCVWDGGFLPSEAEWEYAAAGGSQQREYPWGSTDPGTSNEYAIYNVNYLDFIAPVGTPTLGAGLWGQLDLVGELWEWNLDWYAAYVDPCTDCADTTAASNRVVRGGSFDNPAQYVRPPVRNFSAPTTNSSRGGFRCARTP